jgi:hypothetical protein
LIGQDLDPQLAVLLVVLLALVALVAAVVAILLVVRRPVDVTLSRRAVQQAGELEKLSERIENEEARQGGAYVAKVCLAMARRRLAWQQRRHLQALLAVQLPVAVRAASAIATFERGHVDPAPAIEILKSVARFAYEVSRSERPSPERQLEARMALVEVQVVKTQGGEKAPGRPALGGR